MRLDLGKAPDVARELLDQTRAFGLLGCYANIVLPLARFKGDFDLFREISTADIEVLDARASEQNLDLRDHDWMARRVAPVSPLFEVSSQPHLPRFDADFPLLYRVAGWPKGVPPAGRLADAPGCTLNEAIASLQDFWHLQLHRPHGSLVASTSATLRVVRAALWRVHEAGFEAALDYLIALIDNGFFLDWEVPFSALWMLLATRRAAPDDGSLAAFVLKELPATADDWPRAEFTRLSGCVLSRRELTDDAELLCRFVEGRAEAARAAVTLDEWIIAYARLGIAASAAHRTLSAIGLGGTLGFSPSVKRFQEFSADAVSYFTSLFAASRDRAAPPGPRYASCLRPGFHAAVAMATKAMGKPPGWLDYLAQERVLVPDALLPLLEPGKLSLMVSLPEAWQRPTPFLAPILGWLSFRDASWSRHRMINDNVFVEPSRVSAALVALGVDAKALTPFVVLLLAAQADEAGQTFPGETRAEAIELASEDIASLLGVAPDALPAWLDEVHLQLSLDDAGRIDWDSEPGDGVAQAEALVRAYPFNGMVHAIRAFHLSRAGRLEEGWTAARNAVLLDPHLATTWRSASLLLGDVGTPDDVRIVAAIAETIDTMQHDARRG